MIDAITTDAWRPRARRWEMKQRSIAPGRRDALDA
jgi:hypothetical protein